MATNGRTTALTKRKKLGEFLQQRTDKLAQWARGAVDPLALVRFAMLEFTTSPKMQRCSLESIYLSLIASAQLGLEPGGVHSEAHFVPFGDQCTLIPGYQGLIKLALQSGAVTGIYGATAYERDPVFDPQLGTSPGLTHKLAIGKRGNPIACYAVAFMANGQPPRFEVLGWDDDIKKIRDHATRKSSSPAWRDWPEMMGRKSAIRRLCKTIPMSSAFAQAARIEETAAAGDLEGYRNAIEGSEEFSDVIDIEPESSNSAGYNSIAADGKAAATKRRRGRPRKPPAEAKPEPADPLDKPGSVSTQPAPMTAEEIAEIEAQAARDRD